MPYDHDLERPTYTSSRRGAPPPPMHSPSHEHRLPNKGGCDAYEENRHPNGATRRGRERTMNSPPPLGKHRSRMAPPRDSPPRRDARPTPERADYRKGYEAAKIEILRSLSGATDDNLSRHASRERRPDSPPRRSRERSSPSRRERRASPERRSRERRPDSPPRRERRQASPERRSRPASPERRSRQASPERRSRQASPERRSRQRAASREGRRDGSRRADSQERGRDRREDSRTRSDGSRTRKGDPRRDNALRRSEETWERSSARAEAVMRRRSPTPDSRRRSPSPGERKDEDDFSLAPATRGVLMDDDASKASEAASELTADEISSPIKPLRSMKATSTRGRLQMMAFEGVTDVPSPLEPSEDRKIPLLQCFMERKKSTFGPQELTLKLQSDDRALLVARKTSRSGNYHIFDATRGQVGAYSKKGGNYLGKLIAPKNTDLGGGSAHHRVLVDGTQRKLEHALFIHKRTSTITSFVDGAKPRQVSVALPGTSAKAELLKRFSHSDDSLTVLEQRQPKLVDGQYSLNFYGRATVASVKNFQLVPGLADDTVVYQLGKVGDHEFNLDFAPPFTPFSAFALAVSQF